MLIDLQFPYLLLQVLLYWYSTEAEIIKNAVILFLYYLIGNMYLRLEITLESNYGLLLNVG